MKKIFAKLVLFVSFFSLLGTGLVTASAATISAQGGIWNYGIGDYYVWPYYSHNSKTHCSTAIGRYRSDSGDTRPGKRADASARKGQYVWQENKTYYGVN